MEIGSEARLLPNTGSEVKFLNIKVKNIKRNFLHRLLINSNTANNARAWVSFHDPITKGELLKINGRWTSTKEPVDYHGGVNIGDALVVSRETLPPNEETEISVAVKENQKKNVYAFNNESYLYSWKKPDFELEEKRYLVKVKVSADGKEWNGEFILLNLGKSIRHFKLLKSE